MNSSLFLPVLYLLVAAVIALVARSLASGIASVTTSSWAGIITGGIVAVIGLVNSVLTSIKTVQEIRLNKRKLYEQDRRSDTADDALQMGRSVDLQATQHR